VTKVENGITLSKNDLGNNGKGSYVLITRLPEGQSIAVGSLQVLYFPRGDYAYVGSALGGFKARLSHHLRPEKKPHWHIDYLLQRASIRSIILCDSLERTECTITRAISNHFTAIPGFGASDCRCHSHLFWTADGMKEEIMTILKALNMNPRVAK